MISLPRIRGGLVPPALVALLAALVATLATLPADADGRAPAKRAKAVAPVVCGGKALTKIQRRRDTDRDRTPNFRDADVDGDRRANGRDRNADGDRIPNARDTDVDG